MGEVTPKLMDARPLTLKYLSALISAFHAAHGSAFPIGVAVSPHADAILKRHENPSRWNIPRIVDPRLTLDRNEVYYDHEAWRARCKEQREWDAAGRWSETQNHH